MKRFARVLFALPGLAIALAASARMAFSFGVIGDMPYSAGEEPLVAAMLDQMGREPLEFILHVGDFKSGHSLCTDELYRERREMLDRSEHPLILTPGDNDWTDCHRFTGGGFDPVERLKRLRSDFYTDQESLGRRRITLQRQSDDAKFAAYRENVRWTTQGVVFVALHVVGSNNNRGRSVEADREFRERTLANADWLSRGFAEARRDGIRGLVVFLHANPGLERAAPMSGYIELVEQLRREAPKLKKPVLVIHGDTHAFRFDRPWAGEAGLARLLRVETFGSPLLNWVRVDVDPQHPLLFRVRPGTRSAGDY